MRFGKCHEIGKPRHTAIIIHNLADNAGWVSKPCGARDIDNSFGMPSPHKRPTITRHQWEDMTGCGNITFITFRIDGGFDGMRSVMRRYAGGHPFTGLDRDGKGCFMT